MNVLQPSAHGGCELVASDFTSGAKRYEGVVCAGRKRREKRQPLFFSSGKRQKVYGPADANAVFARRVAPRGVVKAPRRDGVASSFRRKNRGELVEVQSVRHVGDGFGFKAKPRVA